jgi:P-type Ca2+ transporter type 2C
MDITSSQAYNKMNIYLYKIVINCSMENIPYHQYSVDKTFDSLKSSQEGLSESEINSRSNIYGKNKLAVVKGESIFLKVFRQIKDLMVIILLVAGVLSIFMNDYRSATIMFLIVALNAIIGFFQEYKAERLIKSLKLMITKKAKVIRNNQIIEIKSEDLVPGDIVKLEEGDAVPADVRLFEEHEFSTNDFALTGESNPTRKFTHEIEGDVSLGDRNNIAFMGTTVATGSALGIVINTGMQTEIGRIAHLSQSTANELSPLQKELNNLAKRVTIITLVIASILFIIALLVHFTLHDAFLFAVGVAACMVPEGLPAEVSVALSLAASRLAKKKAIIKKLSAVETLGSTHIICTDKTGTLTKNEMTVQKIFIGNNEFDVTGIGYQPAGEILDKSGKPMNEKRYQLFFQTGIFASNARISPPDKEHQDWYAIGDPTEAAIITLGEKAGLKPSDMDKSNPEIKEFAFDATRKRMSSVRNRDGHFFLYAKGAPQSILDRCTHIWDGMRVHKITDKDKALLKKKDQEFALSAFRNIAFAYRRLDSSDAPTSIKDAEKNLVFLGLVAMLDPPREDVKEAMAIAEKAHIRVIIITGDFAPTAEAIAKKIRGEETGQQVSYKVITDSELNTMSDIDLVQTLDADNLIFARTSPEDKLRIVSLLKKADKVVAVTGDGVNDAPALKKADIGVAMGKTGTEVAKDSSEIILLDDSFGTLVAAISEGRTIFQNITKTIRSSLTTNTGELTVVLLSLAATAFFDIPLAILTLQILAVDLVGQLLPVTFLTWDPPQKEIMTQYPRNPKEHILNKHTFRNMIWTGFLMGLIAFLNFIFFFYRNDSSPLNIQTDSLFYVQATTLTYVTLVLISFMNLLSKRVSDNESIFSPYLWSNKGLLWSFGISLLFVLALVYMPICNAFLNTAPLSLLDWIWALGGAILFLLIYELIKLMKRFKMRT